MGGDRLQYPSADNHYVHLANSFLHGRLDQIGPPPGTNDWACYDTDTKESCPNGRWNFGNQERYKFYVSFPPFPAVVIAPAVAIFGIELPDRLFWCLLAGFVPLFCFLLLEDLRKRGISDRSRNVNLLLTALFAFGSVFYFSAVQGTVWFAAQVVACSLLFLYLRFAIGARRPLLAGIMLALLFLTRPTTAFLAIFFGLEAMRRMRSAADAGTADSFIGDRPFTWPSLFSWIKSTDFKATLRLVAIFGAPILAIGFLAMWINYARFENIFEFGHSHLQIVWRDRIERWGLFNYHYLAKNLAVFFGSLPWLSINEPHIKISQHGLALWFTMPFLLYALFPQGKHSLRTSLWLAVIPVTIINLMYQNSGWVQFGYRFALDYLPLVFVALAISKRRVGPLFIICGLFAIVVNTFGAITFDRTYLLYDNDPTQERIFQPDKTQ